MVKLKLVFLLLLYMVYVLPLRFVLFRSESNRNDSPSSPLLRNLDILIINKIMNCLAIILKEIAYKNKSLHQNGYYLKDIKYLVLKNRLDYMLNNVLFLSTKK
jgi:hypothetical protein